MEIILTAALYEITLTWASALFLMMLFEYQPILRKKPIWLPLIAGGIILSYGLATLYTSAIASLVPLYMIVSIFWAVRSRLKDFSAVGQYFYATNLAGTVFGLFWGFWFMSTIPVSPLTRVLMSLGSIFLIVKIPMGLVHSFELSEVLGRVKWHRPKSSKKSKNRKHYPKICFQVPTYSEPPDLVRQTLEALTRVDYPNFYVMVIDNNTRDPKLWKPIQEYCRELGDRFHFYHLEKCPGAKAGALNFAMTQIDADVELIAVIDSDYVVQPNFLSNLVEYFDDPKMGFVQARHAYRDVTMSQYLSMCDWEYRSFFATTLISRNERNAGITVGTMSLIRKRALNEAGGWAEWCLTEDSELAVRIHAQGYESSYINEAFGRGLITKTFEGYKKQRFRWTFGPVQELKRHFRYYLPRRWAKPSQLTTAQKWHHLTHGLENVDPGLGLLTLPLYLAVLVSMIVHKEIINIPDVIWFTGAVMTVLGPVMTLFVYQTKMGCTIKEAFGGWIASASLAPTKMIASAASIIKKDATWHRTNKFKVLPSRWRFLNSIQLELALAVGFATLGAVSFALLPRSGFSYVVLVGVMMQIFGVAAAASMAYISEKELLEEHLASSKLVPANVSLEDDPTLATV
jgi:cellulose synthase/poly-beta-1,6-N-acetylglucosamine synthase-like glycosyltransferase